ncbi:MAG: alpha/beta fold hydrolase [Anaerovoracaceae bacterium]
MEENNGDFLKQTDTFKSADGRHNIYSYYYRPVKDAPKAVIQLCHGMSEYIERYEPMIAWYTKHGYAVAGCDHLGHGRTAEPEERGFFAAQNGWEFVTRDQRQMNRHIHEEWPGKPVFFYGHSMGSFFARLYAMIWPDTINGLIISGTAGPSPMNGVGKKLASVISAVRGPRHISRTIVKANMGKYNDKIKDPVNANAWLSRDDEVCIKYREDPLCGFPFTASAYRDMLTVLCKVSDKKWFQTLDRDLPVLIVSGGMDPVGNYGEGVRKVFSMLIDAGQKDLTCQIWPEDRHEIHNELDKLEVYSFIDGWLDDRLEGPLTEAAAEEEGTGR